MALLVPSALLLVGYFIIIVWPSKLRTREVQGLTEVFQEEIKGCIPQVLQYTRLLSGLWTSPFIFH